MPEESIKVAVRLRPFNQREKDRNAKLIIKMEGKSTFITDPKAPYDEPKQFSFDYSYWSHDGFVELPSGILEADNSLSPYASQQKVFDDLGRDVLKNAFDGFNCSLFAYGQTGSGKSYSMIGYGVNRGIVPIVCDELFHEIQNAKSPSTRYEICLSMMEIYNEQVRDLLNKEFPKGGLVIHQHPTSGHFYPQGLRIVPVGTYNDIERRVTEGTENRTIAATNMNATSSRAHTVVTIYFDQIIKDDRGETKKTSVINLVDLAGSERSSSTGATGDRLKEGTNINKSLSTLGNVIAALAEMSSGTKRKLVVPYRESVLTKLLQNALGGNSKTVMIAALSPTDVSHDETLSTLRFADRVKRIKNTVVVNENPIEKLIRELKAENERLRLLIDTGKYNLQLDILPSMTNQDIEAMRKKVEEEILSQIQVNQQMLQSSKTSWDLKLKNAQLNEKKSSQQSDKKVPYLANLNEDPMLSYIILHYFNTDTITIGSRNSTICLTGLNILEKHATIRAIDSCKYELIAAEPGAKIKVNGYNLNGSAQLRHKDRILFGANHVYVYLCPSNEKEALPDLPSVISWEFAQKEIAKAKGYSLGNNLTVEQEEIQEKILSLLPLLSEVNAISEELNKYRTFEIVLMPISSWEGTAAKGSKVLIKMRNLLNQNVWYWDDARFINRSYIIKEHYQKFLDGDEEILYMSKDDDPFWEPVEEVLLGTANVFLQSLAYSLDFSDEICIVDYKGSEQGRLSINLSPCSSSGKVLNDEQFIDQPEELLNQPFSFKITMRYIEISDERHNKGIRIRYKIFNESEFTETNVICRHAVCANVKQSRIITVPSIDEDWLNFFQNSSVIFQIFALQEESKPNTGLFKMTTRDLKRMEQKQDNTNLIPVVQPNFASPSDSKLKSELTLLQKKYNRLEQKEKRIQQLCHEWENNHDFQKFYKLLSAISFSSGTKLKASTTAANKDANVDVYLFGIEEQEYAEDIEQSNADKRKYWNEYHRKIALKQRRTSVSFRLSLKLDSANTLPLPSNDWSSPPANIDRPNQNGQKIPDDRPQPPLQVKSSPQAKKKLNQEFANDNNDQSNENNPPMINSKAILSCNGTGNGTENEAFINKKNSTICIIQ
ncbi:unnamed protein product [Rotaria socialis]|uniref:Kinesin motor domain-containing protein n=2 Tax=Rotaria socialis TaxID=392032 RepID=A0A817U4Z9_9BILA|nr:unnamed protein product [Rotaria socialis]CAF3327238.1 unnamed protein product [Rotaria socialis]CAF4215021.1 unnamed protein product [Rotaria socialis]